MKKIIMLSFLIVASMQADPGTVEPKKREAVETVTVTEVAGPVFVAGCVVWVYYWMLNRLYGRDDRAA